MENSTTIYQRMGAVFAAANVPGFLQEWRQTDAYPAIPPKFCAYVIRGERAAMCADNREWIHRTDVELHIYGKTDVSAERESVVQALENAGFEIAGERDLDDVRAGEYQYHRRLEIVYFEEVQ